MTVESHDANGLLARRSELEALAGAKEPPWDDKAHVNSDHARILAAVEQIETDYPDALPEFRHVGFHEFLGRIEHRWSSEMRICREKYYDSPTDRMLLSCDLPGRLCPRCGPSRFLADREDVAKTAEPVRHFLLEARKPSQGPADSGYLKRVRDNRFKDYIKRVTAAQATFFVPFDTAALSFVANALVTVLAVDAPKMTDSGGWQVAALDGAISSRWQAAFELERETYLSVEVLATALKMLRPSRFQNYGAWYGPATAPRSDGSGRRLV